MAGKRLFFALWPDDNTRHAIVAVSQTLPKGIGRIIPACNLHLTLAFLGKVPDTKLHAVAQAANQIRTTPFTLHIDKFGWWAQPGVLWLRPSVIPKALHNLALDLQTMAGRHQLSVDRRPYMPHISIARHVTQSISPPQFQAIDWYCDSFQLIESRPTDSGSEYQVLQHWRQ